MKRISALIVAIAAVFALTSHAKAAPMYYTFDGFITSISDTAGIIAETDLASDTDFTVGGAVTYTLLVDLAADGTSTMNDGTVNTNTDNANYDYFFTDYVSGDALWQKDGGDFNADDFEAEYNVGYNDLIYLRGYLDVNSFDDRLQIYSNASPTSVWAAGTAVTGWNYAYDNTGAYSQLWYNLTLTSISAVPEPGTLLLLGSGLVGLGLVRRRFRG